MDEQILGDPKESTEAATALFCSREPTTHPLRRIIEIQPGERVRMWLNSLNGSRGGLEAGLMEMDGFKEILRHDLEAEKTSWECFCNRTRVTVEKTNARV